MFSSYLAGFSLGLSLILAIGAQNAFVLKQGIKQQHVFVVCLICALSDAILIVMGVMGFGFLVKQFPIIEVVARYAGAAFLLVYSALSFRSAFSVSHNLKPADESEASLLKTAVICLAFTWLNPHVYLDTVVLLGSVSTQYEATKLQFAAGAVFSSFLFFFSLGYGARLLRGVFEQPRAWKVLEVFIGITMLLLAVLLLLG